PLGAQRGVRIDVCRHVQGTGHRRRDGERARERLQPRSSDRDDRRAHGDDARARTAPPRWRHRCRGDVRGRRHVDRGRARCPGTGTPGPERPFAAWRTAMIEFELNGKKVAVDATPDTPVLWVLRDHLGMTGTKFGCGKTLCRACTVYLNGTPTFSCRMPLST